MTAECVGCTFNFGQTAERKAQILESNGLGSDDKIDYLVANALNQLSLDERETLYHELHGVDEIIEETSELVDISLNELDIELERIRHSHPKSSAYNLADEMSPDYVLDQTLRMKFLRSEKFNARKSAERMIRFFDCKLYFFGEEKLCKDITLQDLDKDDLKALKAGYMQILPARDRAGRAVFLNVPSKQTFKTPNNKYRAMFYMAMTMADDVETQKRGISIVVYNVEKFERDKYQSNAVEHTTWLQNCVPLKTCSLHYCISDTGFRYVINIALRFYSEDARARVKVHFGTHLECCYSLLTFGCPVNRLPISLDGTLKRKTHLEFIKMRHQQESRAGLPRIVLPAHDDVLFGRGKPFRQHVANIELHAMMEEEMKLIESLHKGTKVLPIARLTDAIRLGGGRFLQQDNEGCWVELDEQAVHEKVNRSFRSRLRHASSQK